MRVLLLNPPWAYKLLYTHGIYPPYGLLMVGTLLKEAGFDVSILDANAEGIELPELKARMEAEPDWDVLGITTFTDTFAFCEDFGPWCKARWPERPLVLGGPLVSGAPELVSTAAQADVAALDEAYTSVVPMMRALADGAGLDEVAGLLISDGVGGFRRTGRAAAAPDLDALPWPDWELLDVEAYLRGGPGSFQRKRRLPRYLSIITSLGCPYRCTFCQVPNLFEGLRLREPARVAAELASYRDRWDVRSMYFRDDILFRPRKLAHAFEEAELGLEWSCLLRADMFTAETLRAMKAGGCAQIRVGFESGSDEVLDAMAKQTTVQDNVRCIELAAQAGIDLSGFLIVGLPGETERSLAATLDFVQRNGARASVHFPLPLPATPLFDQARADGRIPDVAGLLRRFSAPQLPGQVLQPPPINFTALPDEVLLGWAGRIAEAARGPA
jgi:anaerobic magnesium-protoporphyrin IX monomethyl ester cyclase